MSHTPTSMSEPASSQFSPDAAVASTAGASASTAAGNTAAAVAAASPSPSGAGAAAAAAAPAAAPHRPPRPRCEVCNDTETDEFIMTCKVCKDCTVHPSCYGVNTDVLPDGAHADSIVPSFTCLACALRLAGSASAGGAAGAPLRCALCGHSGGALKPTERGQGEWAHIVCAMYIPECWIDLEKKPNTICGFQYIPASRKSLTCVICEQRSGYCVPCSWTGRSGKGAKSKGCSSKPFHVFCASRAAKQGYCVEMREVKEGGDDFSVAKLVHCLTHSAAKFDSKSWLAEQRKAKRTELKDQQYWEKLKQAAKGDEDDGGDGGGSGSGDKKKGNAKRKRGEKRQTAAPSSKKTTSSKATAASIQASAATGAAASGRNAATASKPKPFPTPPPRLAAEEDSGDEGKSDMSDEEGMWDKLIAKRIRTNAMEPSKTSPAASASAAAASAASGSAGSSPHASIKSGAEMRQFYERVVHTEAAAKADARAQSIGAVTAAPPLHRSVSEPRAGSSGASWLMAPVASSSSAATAASAAAPLPSPVRSLASELGVGSAAGAGADEEVQLHLDTLPSLLPLFNIEGEMNEFSVLAQVSHRVLSPLVPVGGVGGRGGTPSLSSRVGSSPSPLGAQRRRPSASDAGSFSTPRRADEHGRAFDGKENAGALLLNFSQSTTSPLCTPASGTSFTFQTPTQGAPSGSLGSVDLSASLHLHTPSSLQSFDTPPEVAAAAAAAAAKKLDVDVHDTPQQSAKPSASNLQTH